MGKARCRRRAGQEDRGQCGGRPGGGTPRERTEPNPFHAASAAASCLRRTETTLLTPGSAMVTP